jgi:spore germination protein YaaH
LSLLADRLQGQITITGRPELDPGYPVVVPFGNRVYFAETVENSLQINNEYSTTISLSHGHKPWDFVPEFMTYGHDQLSGGSGKSTKGKTP